MRAGRQRATLAALGVAAAILSACEPVIVNRVNEQREASGVPRVPVAQYLTESTRKHSAGMCSAGAATPSPDPAAEYGGETAVALDELVASAALDPVIEDSAERNLAATDEIWAAWENDPTLVDPRWDEIGVGETECGDGRLYMTAVLRENPSMPASGVYVTAVYTAAQIQVLNGLEYGEAVDYQGNTVDLLLDLYLPPAGPVVERPTIVMVHGGGFCCGSRSAVATSAHEYARRGFVAASIDYRLRPNDTPAEQLAAATDAIDDGMESVRWLKANAATYGIDTQRIATAGTSAGGAIALGVAVAEDPTPGGPLGSFTPDVAAGVSTGAHLTPGLDRIDFQATDAPVMMFHYEQDTSRGRATWEYAYQTCTAVRESGNVCDFIRQPGEGHTVPIGPQGVWWVPEIGPFFWYHLELAAVA